jgi:hypothetical protein
MKGPCTICERITGATISFTDVDDPENERTVIRICFECIGKGLRWIVRQADRDEALSETDGERR